MGKYLKMADVFDCEVESDADLMFSDSLGSIADFSGYKTQCRYATHAINSHDELVAEVERLRLMISECYPYIKDKADWGNEYEVDLANRLFDASM